jgi:cobalt-zinc-cadmium efflux system outer membrane protein
MLLIRRADRGASTRCITAALAAALVAAPPVNAAPLTFDGAIAVARANAPSLRAKALGAAASESARQAAGALPDPKLSLGVEDFPISGPLAFKPSRDDFSGVRVGLSQVIPNLAKRRAQRTRADADIAVAIADAVMEERTVAVETGVAWIALVFAQKRLAVLDGVRTGLAKFVGTTPASVASGSARPAQTVAGKQALAALDDRRDELVAAMSTARANLGRWTGDPDPSVAGRVPEFEIDPVALEQALDANPVIAPLTARLGQARADVRLAEADRRPDFGVDVSYLRRDPRFGDYLSAGMTVGLPLFQKHRQQPLIAARQAEAAQRLAEQEATRRELAARLQAALADHVMHHAQWVRSRDTLEPLAHQRVDLETASYSAGRASLVDVADAEAALVDVALTTLDREALVAIDGARLTLTYRGAIR